MRTQNSSLLMLNYPDQLGRIFPADSAQRKGRRMVGGSRKAPLRVIVLFPFLGALLSLNAAKLEWKVLEEAHEIINIGTVLAAHPEEPVATYKSAGSSPIPDDLWPAYVPPLPYLKNTTRNLQFNESQFLASPGEPIGTTTYVTTPDRYTWGAMSLAINAIWPYNPTQYSGPAAVN